MATQTTLPGKFKLELKDDSGNTYYKTISFSKGNLEYKQGDNIFRFGVNQYDFVGGTDEGGNIYGNVYYTGKGGKTEKCDNAQIAYSGYTGWIDLFGWGTGFNPSGKTSDWQQYPGFEDWGYNEINGEQKNWKTPTIQEWEFLLRKRNVLPTFGTIKVDSDDKSKDVRGYFLIPDNWSAPTALTPDNITYTINIDTTLYSQYEFGHIWDELNYDEFNINGYTLSEWDLLEKSGVVFLPTTGYRFCTTSDKEVTPCADSASTTYDYDLPNYHNIKHFGSHYWSSIGSTMANSLADYVILQPNTITLNEYDRSYGYGVRLIRDIINTAITIDTVISDEDGNPILMYITDYMNTGFNPGQSWYTDDKSFAESGTTETAKEKYIIASKPYYINLDEEIWDTSPQKMTNYPYKRKKWIGHYLPFVDTDDTLDGIKSIYGEKVYDTVAGWEWELNDVSESETPCQVGCSQTTLITHETMKIYMCYDDEKDNKVIVDNFTTECCETSYEHYIGTYSYSDTQRLLFITRNYTDEGETFSVKEKYKVNFEKDTTLPQEDRHRNDLMWMYYYDDVLNFNTNFINMCTELEITTNSLITDIDMETQNSLFYLLPNEMLIKALKSKNYDCIVGTKTDANGVQHYSVYLLNDKKTIDKNKIG